MAEIKHISDLTPDQLRQSEGFLTAQKKWNEYFNSKPEPTEFEKQYFKKVYKDSEEKEPILYEHLRDMFWSKAKEIEGYKVNDPATYRELTQYFLNPEKEKGILIAGGTGSGKTLFFKLMQMSLLNLRIPAFRIVSCIDVEQAIRSEQAQYSDFAFGDMCFDDLGTESAETVIYGNRVNVMSEIIQIRYNAFQNKGLKTHYTTNLTPDEIEKRYGTRISDRLNEACTNYIFSWDSFRK